MTSRAWPLNREPDSQQDVPTIDDRMPLSQVLQQLAYHIVRVVDVPHSFEELRSAVHGRAIDALVESLSRNVHYPAILPALLALRGYFMAHDEDDEHKLNLSRAYACEIVAWRFVTHLSEREALEYLLTDLPKISDDASKDEDIEAHPFIKHMPVKLTMDSPSERTQLLPSRSNRRSRSRSPNGQLDGAVDNDPELLHFTQLAISFAGLNALEIATVSDAKKFLSQRAVQRIVDGIWDGTYVFWQTLSADTQKKISKWDQSKADPFCRLRVPLYAKIFEVFFFAAFLGLYYTVLIARTPDHITGIEIMLLIWIASFAYDEFGQYIDAGATLYATDFWSLLDLSIVVIGMAFLVLRIVGLAKHDKGLTDNAFDVLALEALFLFPRICSLLSLNQFFGTLIPCLKEMTKYACKFMLLVLIIYLGWLTTFVLLARDHYKPSTMALILVKVFFGSSYLGFDAANNISPVFGLVLVTLFIFLSNILLSTSLISLLSNSITEVMSHAREEYLFQYSVFVLEASTSNRLTYFFPPLNLVALLLRPLRLFISVASLRQLRIVLLKCTHWPHVLLITAYETVAMKASAQPKLSSWGKLIHGPSGKRQPSSTLKATASLLSSPAYQTPRRLHLQVDGAAPGPRTWLKQTGLTSTYSTKRTIPRPDGDVYAQVDRLAAQVEHLSSKIDDLIDVVARQQDAGADQHPSPS